MDTATRADPDAILARFRSAGAPRDLGELFDATSGDLYRVALATAPDTAAAEDAVQETYLAVIGAAARWDPSRRAMPWLLGILRFKITRQREKARIPASVSIGRDAAAPETSDDAPEAAALAWAEIERLDEPYRAVALLRWRYGLSPTEIAHVRSEAPGTTRSLLSRALDRVRRTLKVMPAALALGGRPTRGLAAVRMEVQSGVGTPAALVAANGFFTAHTLMTTGLLVAFCGGVFWAIRPEAPATPSRVSADRPTSEAAMTLAVPPARAIAVDAPAVPAMTGPVAHGRVVDAAGRPIVIASISSVGSDAYAFERPAGFESDGPPLPPGARTAHVGADGRFGVALDDEYPTHRLFVSAPGFAPSIVGAVRPSADVGDVILGMGEGWSGRVVDAARAPIEGATVRACVVMPWFAFVRVATTDASGAFQLESMPAPTHSRLGVMAMTAWIEGSAAGFAPSVVSVSMAQASPRVPTPSGVPADNRGGRNALDLTLRPGARLVGHVVDADTGQSIPMAQVRLDSTEMATGWMQGDRGAGAMRRAESPFQNVPITATQADSFGAFALDHVPCLDGPRPPPVDGALDRRPFAGRVTASATGYAPGQVLVRRIEEGGTDTFEIKLFHAAVVTGRLVDGEGRALAGVAVSIEVPPPAAWGDGCTTDAEGRYVLRDIPAPAAGTEARIHAFNDSGRVEATVVLRGGSKSEIPDLVLRQAERPTDLLELRVRVVDTAGAPIWGAYTQFVMPGVGPGSMTDRDGHALIPITVRRVEAAESIEVAAFANGYARSSVRKPREAARSEEFVVTLQIGRRIAGLVRLANGTPASGAIVRAERRGAAPETSSAAPVDPDRPQTGTDSTGQFAFDDLPDDSFAITAMLHTELPSSLAPSARVDSVRAGTTGLVIQLSPDQRGALGRLEVSVIDDATGGPLDGGYVRLRRGKEETIWAHHSAKGRHVAEGIPIGSWNVRVFVDEYVLEIVPDVPIEATPRSGPLEVRLRRAAKRALRVTGAPTDGPPKTLSFTSSDGSGAQAVRDSEGRYTVVGLRTGSYRVSLGFRTESDPGPMTGWVAEGNFIDVPSGDDPIDVRLVPAGAITVRVEDPLLADFDAKDAPEATRARSEKSSLVLRDDRQRVMVKLAPLRLHSPSDISGLPLAPGRYQLRLERPGEPIFDSDIEIPAGVHVLRAIGGTGGR